MVNHVKSSSNKTESDLEDTPSRTPGDTVHVILMISVPREIGRWWGVVWNGGLVGYKKYFTQQTKHRKWEISWFIF